MSATPREHREPRARDRIEVDVPEKGPHPAVVLHVEPRMMIVAVGSSTEIDDVEVVRFDRDPQLRTARLRPGTIFYERHIQPVFYLGSKRDIWGKCPPHEFDRLFDAMEKVATEARAGTREIATIPRKMRSLVERMKAMGSPAITEALEPTSVGGSEGAHQPAVPSPPQPVAEPGDER